MLNVDNDNDDDDGMSVCSTVSNLSSYLENMTVLESHGDMPASREIYKCAGKRKDDMAIDIVPEKTNYICRKCGKKFRSCTSFTNHCYKKLPCDWIIDMPTHYSRQCRVLGKLYLAFLQVRYNPEFPVELMKQMYNRALTLCEKMIIVGEKLMADDEDAYRTSLLTLKRMRDNFLADDYTVDEI